MRTELDDFDRAILDRLRDNARLSNLELAEAIHLSHSAISRRIRRLETEQVIRGYRAVIDPLAGGEAVRAFSAVQRQSQVPAIDVARSLRDTPGVVGCWIVSGEFDILIEVAARDMAHFSALMLEGVQKVAGVAATRSMFILNPLRER
jgi:Lrp/AsnC family leucine-responsive transcriptional regulator